MGVIVTIFLLVIACVIISSKHEIYQPTFVFCIVYGIIMFFESFHLYGMNESQDITYLIILIGTIFFCLGTALMSRVTLTVHSHKRIDLLGFNINYKACIVLLIFSIGMTIYPAVNNLLSVRQLELTFSAIRADFGNYYDNQILNLLFNYIVNPFTGACLPITAVILFKNVEKKEKRTLLILTVFFIVLTVLSNAGRGIILYFMAMVFFAYKIETADAQVDPQKSKKRKKYKKIFGLIFVIAIWGYIAVTKLRGTSDGSRILNQIYVYICGCIPHLDYRINQIRAANVCLYGTGGCHGLFQFVFTMLENFGIMKYPAFMTVSDTWYTNALSYVSIGPNISFNAYATLFYNCFLDGGLFAVIIEMFVYGCVCGAMYRRIKSNPSNVRDELVFIYLLYGVVFSFIRFQFTLHSHWIAIVMLVLLTKRTDANSEE